MPKPKVKKSTFPSKIYGYIFRSICMKIKAVVVNSVSNSQTQFAFEYLSYAFSKADDYSAQNMGKKVPTSFSYRYKIHADF